MNAALVFALSLAAQDAPAVDVPISDPPPVDVAPAAVAPREAPVTIERTLDARASDVDERYAKTHAVLVAFADEGRSDRIVGALTSGVLGAGLIGIGVTYVAVGQLDHQLSQKDFEDTEIAGIVIGGSALIPAAILVGQLVSTSAEEDRLAAFEGATTNEDKAARIEAARASIAVQASGKSWAPTLGGVAFIGGGLVSAAVGGVFLALPHIPDVERGPMTHATGAELIGAGVSSLGVGTAMLLSSGSSAPLQMKLLETEANAAAE